MKQIYSLGRTVAMLLVLSVFPQYADAYETITENRSFGPYGVGEEVVLPEGLSTIIFHTNFAP